MLNLETFLTTGEKETRAWTITKGTLAPQAAGVIHTDFEAGFIRANVIDYDTFVKFGNYKEAKDKGLSPRRQGLRHERWRYRGAYLMFKIIGAAILIGVSNLIPGISGATIVLTNQYNRLVSEVSLIVSLKLKQVDIRYLFYIALGQRWHHKIASSLPDDRV